MKHWQEHTTILVTGGTGFVGHHLIEHFLSKIEWNVGLEIIILDRLDKTSTLNRLRNLSNWDNFQRYVRFVWHDLKAPIGDMVSKEIGQVDFIVHLAASSHVDRSIEDPLLFAMDNVIGTTNILNFARTQKNLQTFINFSTDEVFGPAPEGVRYREWDRFKPGNPYAASKAGAESMADAFCNTYGLPVITTHTMNVIGERQHPEKFIPKAINAILRGDVLPIHSNKDKTRAGSRFWIHAANVSDAVLFVMMNGVDGEKYNIVGEVEIDNLTLAQKIANILDKKLIYEMVDFHSSRPGHDLRYALNGDALASLGWRPPEGFDASLERIVHWYVKNPGWL